MHTIKVRYISMLSVVSAVAVLFLHVNGCFWIYSEAEYWFSANIIECIAYFAVPVFFMLSGATLIDYKEKYSTKIYFCKRMKKALIPFVVWSFIGVLFLILTGGIELEETSIKKILEMVLNTEVIEIYWFFNALFGTYLCIPVLAAIPKGMRKNVYSYIVAAVFVTTYVIPFVCARIGFRYYERIQFDIGNGYLIYVIVGYLLHENELDRKKTGLIYLSGITGFLIHLIGTYVLSREAGAIVGTYKGYQSLPCLLYSVAAYVFLKKSIIKLLDITCLEKVFNCVERMSDYTYAVFLIHFYVIKIVIRIFHADIYSLGYRLVAPFAVFAICVILTKIIRAFPCGKWVLP